MRPRRAFFLSHSDSLPQNGERRTIVAFLVTPRSPRTTTLPPPPHPRHTNTTHATTPTPCARRRLEQLLVDGGAPVEAVRAALGERGRQPALAARTAHEVKVGQGGVVAVAV